MLVSAISHETSYICVQQHRAQEETGNATAQRLGTDGWSSSSLQPYSTAKSYLGGGVGFLWQHQLCITQPPQQIVLGRAASITFAFLVGNVTFVSVYGFSGDGLSDRNQQRVLDSIAAAASHSEM